MDIATKLETFLASEPKLPDDIIFRASQMFNNKLGKFNIYCYDALHREKDQYEGISMAQPALDDVFVLIIDDWNWESVRKGTFGAIKDLNIKIISKIEIKTTQNNLMPKFVHSHYSDWHNGYFMAVCEKSK